MNSEHAPHARSCGACSLCCTVLRVDELKKLGGVSCKHQCEGGGCAIHATRPSICRAYQCLWLSGGLTDDDRPDSLGAIVDILTVGAETRVSIQEATPNAFDRSPRLQEIAAQYRDAMPVRIVEHGNFLDPDRPYRVLLGDSEEHRVRGEWTTVLRPGSEPERRRLSAFERLARRIAVWIRSRKISGMQRPEDRS
jgi:hypothetical protein